MFRIIKQVFVAAFRAFLDGAKKAIGIKQHDEEPVAIDDEVTSKTCAVMCFVGAAVLHALPFPGAPVWAESLFAIGLGLWNFKRVKELT